MEELKRWAYPLKLVPVMKSAVWGGANLKARYGKRFDGEKLAETWELSARTRDESALIENGSLAGMLLCDYFSDFKDSVGTKHRDDRFPLLIKWIDAADKLSVQVHPSDSYALANEGDLGKTEMWYVAEAREGATLVYGMADGVDIASFSAAVKAGDLSHVMKTVPVKAGDVIFIPAGMLHAIGEGIVIAEIQENSNVTYRVYDYGRRDKDGNLRPLHIAQALDVLRSYSEEEILALRYADGTKNEDGTALLCACPYFRASLLSLDGEEARTVDESSFVHLLCTEGEGSISFDGERYPFSRGDGYFLPAKMGEYTLTGKARLLLSSL